MPSLDNHKGPVSSQNRKYVRIIEAYWRRTGGKYKEITFFEQFHLAEAEPPKYPISIKAWGLCSDMKQGFPPEYVDISKRLAAKSGKV